MSTTLRDQFVEDLHRLLHVVETSKVLKVPHLRVPAGRVQSLAKELGFARPPLVLAEWPDGTVALLTVNPWGEQHGQYRLPLDDDSRQSVASMLRVWGEWIAGRPLPTPARTEQHTLEERALAMLAAREDIRTVTSLAHELGCPRSTLYGCRRVLAALNVAEAKRVRRGPAP